MIDDSSQTPSSEPKLHQWHRLFGIALVETLAGRPWRVELEVELALRSQLLDVAIIEKDGHGAVGEGSGQVYDLPDGIENLRVHNLLSYKSHHEGLDAWVLDELVGHFVNYRKIRLSPSGKRYPISDFGLYVVVTRFPAKFQHKLEPTEWEGVYEITWGSQRVRVIVLNAIATHPRNLPWELFASEQERFQQGVVHFRARSSSGSRDGHWALLERLHLVHLTEGMVMAYDMKEFLRETKEMMLAQMPIDDRLRGLNAEEVIGHFKPEEVLGHFKPEEVLGHFKPDDILKNIDISAIEDWLAKQKSL